MKRVAIVGGGIAGLSAAFELEQQRRGGAAVEYRLYEAAPRLGGVLRTERVDGCIVEAGPDSFLSEKPWAAELCREAGLADQLVGSNDAARRTFIVVHNRLVPLPDGLQFMVPTRILPTVFSPLFSFSTKLRAVAEWFAQPQVASDDESVADFVERHFGREMVERVADPLLAGVYGGEAARLSVRATLPRMAELESRYGSLVRGMLAVRRKFQGASPTPIFTTLQDGMQTLADAVAAHLKAEWVRTSSAVRDLRRAGAAWSIGSEEFDAVILALPAHAAAELLTPHAAELAEELRGIGYSSSMTMALGYDRAALFGPERARLEGFGFLVPRAERRRVLAVTYVHNKFPHRAPEGRLLLRVFLGGATDPAAVEMPDEAAVATVRAELAQILGLQATPLFTKAYRWPHAMPQYEVGHLERVERIKKLSGALSGLQLAGNAYSGVGVPDCVRSGREAARAVLPNAG
jgi:oxygen-dependent protoporphyrinogen oxidase